ncbi:MAG: hypothetical protein ACN6OB_09905 [Chryseobacterium jejuense]|uniref:hypothetical protein n=1 Tax=Chryseobacterium jejuense TaxID=445960 RepID=UPI003D0D3016
MKKIILIITCFSFISCSTQMKLNKSKDIDILINTPWKFGENNRVNYTIENKSNKTYIIDPYGFSGESYWLFDNKKLNQIDRSRGYYTRHTDDDCQNDLVIIKPGQKIDTNLDPNDRDEGIYDLSKPGKYIWNIKSYHSKGNSMPLTCKSYINTLEKRGYIMLEDSIVAKIPFVR